MIAFISDVHGNYPALKAVIDKIDGLGCRRIISLGDVSGYYCFINECVDLFKSRNILNLMGNHDFYLVSNSECPRSRSVNDLLEYQKKNIRPENLAWLGRSPAAYNNGLFSCVHGGWNNPMDEYMINIEPDYFKRFDEGLFFSGHTHIQKILSFGPQKYCNPGSVGQPRDGNPKAAFAVLEGNTIILHRVAYNIDEIASAMQSAGFDDYYFRGLYSGQAIGADKLRPNRDSARPATK